MVRLSSISFVMLLKLDMELHRRRGEVHVTLLFAQAHVVPLEMARQALKDEEHHHNSMPRLELTAARLAAQLCDMISRESGEVYSHTFLYSDSECILKWINDTGTHFKTFIRNHLTQIHELSGVHEWRYVPTDVNPTDDCSRGLTPGDPKWKRFLEGPEFLWRDESQWPQTSLYSK